MDPCLLWLDNKHCLTPAPCFEGMPVVFGAASGVPWLHNKHCLTPDPCFEGMPERSPHLLVGLAHRSPFRREDSIGGVGLAIGRAREGGVPALVRRVLKRNRLAAPAAALVQRRRIILWCAAARA
eukprot:6190517-Pleurochrysis_carterae.AAC.2